MAKIVSFGDSFIWGSEIPNNRDGSLAWPGLAAKQIGADYETLSDPGCGNDAIARQIYHYFAKHSANNHLAVINWTWTMRWDFYMVKNQTWITLGPTCVPEKLAHIVEQTEAGRVVDFYKDYANSSLLWNKMRSLQAIYAAQQYLKHKGIRSIQTYMDYELFDTQWHAPDYVRELQTLIEPQMHTWDGKNFLDWCRDARHEVTVIGLHPLAAAHRHAAEFWQDRYARSFAD